MNKITLPFAKILMFFLLCMSSRSYAQTPRDFQIYAGKATGGVDPLTNNVAANTVNLNNAVFAIATGPIKAFT